MNQLPILLDALDVATPCTADWDAMTGSDTIRFCGQCGKNVYNLSHMSRPEAEQVVREHEGGLCVRFYRRHDGTLLTRDCPVGLRALRLRIARRIAGVAAMIGTLLFGRASHPLTARGNNAPLAPKAPPRPALMGDFVVPQKVAGPPIMGGACAPPVVGKVALPRPQQRQRPAGWESAVEVTVPATQTWIKTPITVADGAEVELRLDPRFKNVWSSSPTVQNVSADGDANIVAPAGYCLPGRPDGCLVARIADVRHYIGKGTRLAPRKGGVVFLSINDREENQRGDGFKDNDGEMHVLIRLAEKKSAAGR
jgi:hypothetical protein